MVAVIGALTVVWASTSFADDGGMAEPPDISQGLEIQAANVRALGELAAAEAARNSTEEVASRQASRTAYSGLSRAQAENLARDTFPELIQHPTWTGLDIPEGMEVDRYLGDSAAVLSPEGSWSAATPPESIDGAAATERSDPGALIESMLPLRAPGPNGNPQPVDPILEDRGGYVEPRNAAVEAEIPDRLSDGIDLPELDVGLRPEGAGDASEARILGKDKVFFANVDTDTDFVATPTQIGLETFYLLRSTASPISSRLRLALPPGTSVREPAEGFGLLVDGAGAPRAWIAPPTAIDADGTTVPVSMEPEDGDVVIRVDHRGGDFKYPILVDPVIEDYDWYSGSSTCPTSSDPFWHQSISAGGSPNPFLSHACFGSLGLMNATTGGGLNLTNGWLSQWYWLPPPGTFIERVTFDRTAHTSQFTCSTLGIFSGFTSQASNLSDPGRCLSWTYAQKTFTVGSSATYPQAGDPHGDDNNFALAPILQQPL